MTQADNRIEKKVPQIRPFLNMKQEDIDTTEKRANYTIAIIGCEREGLAYGMAFAETGFKVILADSDQSLVKRLTKGKTESPRQEIELKLRSLWRTGKLTATADIKNSVASSDAIVITVNPKIDENKNVDYSEVEKTCKQVGTNLKQGAIIIYTGIASFGFNESIAREALENMSGLKVGEDFGFAYSPQPMLNWHLTSESIFDLELKVAAGDKVSLDVASMILASIAKRGIKQSMNFRTVELASLFSSIRTDASIALSNELAMFCEKAGADYLEIMKLANSEQNLPSCAPTMAQAAQKEPYILIESAENLNMKLRLATLARQLNEDMMKHAINLLQNALRSCSRTVRRSRVAILGATRPKAAGEAFVKMLEARGARTIVYDPNATTSARRDVLEKPRRSVVDAVEGSDCLILLQGQEILGNTSLKNLRTVMRSPSAIIDLTGTLDPQKAEAEGFIYRGLGRGIGKK